jgi:hypothetical protein
MRSKKLLFLVIISILGGCVSTPVKLNTPSGRPEVTISGATKKKISDIIINRELSKGWDLKNQTDSLLIFTRKNTNFGARLLLGSRYDTVPENRLTYTLVENENGIRVFFKAEIVTNPGSAFEQVTDVTLANEEFAEDCQKTLEEIKKDIELGKK